VEGRFTRFAIRGEKCFHRTDSGKRPFVFQSLDGVGFGMMMLVRSGLS
jgi:hypothetical protein